MIIVPIRICAGEGSQMELWHDAEELIRSIEDWKRMGFDHILFGDLSADCDAGLKVFEDVLIYVT